MKALSLWQPWARLIELGIKAVENRDWPTDYRGPLIIQAGKRWKPDEIKAEIDGRLEAGHIGDRDLEDLDIETMRAQLGHAVCVVDIIGCSLARDSSSPWAAPNEDGSGYVFELANPRRVRVEVKGRQKLYSPSKEEREAIERELGITQLEAEGGYAITWEELTGIRPREMNNEDAKEAQRSSRGGRAIEPATRVEMAGAKVELYEHRPHGSLPMDQRWAVRVKSGSSTLYDSSKMGDDGIFEEQLDASRHGEGWQRAQLERRGAIAEVKARRLFAMPDRLDEVDAAREAFTAHKKQVAALIKECSDDHKTLREEQRAPEIGIRFEGGEFTVSEAPALSDGTIGRQWWGAK